MPLVLFYNTTNRDEAARKTIIEGHRLNFDRAHRPTPLYTPIDYDEVERKMNENLARQDHNFSQVQTETRPSYSSGAQQSQNLSRQQESYMGQPVQRHQSNGQVAIQQRSSTPTSRIQSAVNAGRNAVANVLDSISDWAASAADSLRKK